MLALNATAAGGIFRITGISVNGYMFVNSTGALGFNNNTSNTWSISSGGDLTCSTLYLSWNNFGVCNTIPTTVIFNNNSYGDFGTWVKGSCGTTQFNPAISSSSNVNYLYSVFGKTLFLNFTYHTTTAGSRASGIYYYRIPAQSLIIDTNYYNSSSIFSFTASGSSFSTSTVFNDYSNRLRGIRVGSGFFEAFGSSSTAVSVYLVSESLSNEFVLLVYCHTGTPSTNYQATTTYDYGIANAAYSWTAEIPLK